MKKYILTIFLLFLSAPVWAVQTTISQIAAPATLGAYRTAVNSQLANAAANDADLDERVTANKAAALVGDCTVGPCFDGTSDGGNYVKFWAGTGSYWTALQGGAPSANRSWRLPVDAPPSAGSFYLMKMDEYGNMGFVDPASVGGSGTLPTPTVAGQTLIASGEPLVFVPTTQETIILGVTAPLALDPETALLSIDTSGLSGGTGGYVAMTSAPYSDVVCTPGQYGYVGSTEYRCDGTSRWALKSDLTAHVNIAPVMRTLFVTDPGGGNKITCVDAALVPALNCGAGETACSATAPNGSVITGITGVPAPGSSWSAFTGDITGATSTAGTVTMDANKSGSATFSTVAFYGSPGSVESFEGGAFELAAFSETDPGSHITLDSTYAHDGTSGVSFAAGGTAFGTDYIMADLGQLEDSYTLVFWIKTPAASGDYTVRTFYTGSNSTTPTTTSSQTIALAWRGNGSSAQQLYLSPYNGGTSVYTSLMTASTEYRLSLAVTRNGTSVLSIYNTAGTLVATLTTTALDRATRYLYWAAYPVYQIDSIKFNATNP